MDGKDDVTRYEFNQFREHQGGLELKQWELRDRSRDHEELINASKNEIKEITEELRTIKSFFSWAVRLLVGGILASFVTFIIKGGLVL